MNIVSKKLSNSVVYGFNVASVWKKLKNRFDKSNISRIYKLHQEIIDLTQGFGTVATYYFKLRYLWGEYDAMVPIPSCGCPESKVFADYLQQHRLVQFLRGLNDLFG